MSRLKRDTAAWSRFLRGPCIRAEGKTEEQALPPDHPVAAPVTFSMPVQLEKVAGTERQDPVPAAPHVRRLARELGVDIHVVQGSGPGGRISEDDVKLHAKNALAAAASVQAPAAVAAGAHVLLEPELPALSICTDGGALVIKMGVSADVELTESATVT